MHREDNNQLYRMEIKVLKELFIDDILNKFCFDSMFICVHYIEWSDNTWSDKNSNYYQRIAIYHEKTSQR